MKFKDLKKIIVFNDDFVGIKNEKEIQNIVNELESITDECKNGYFLEKDVFGDIHLINNDEKK